MIAPLVHPWSIDHRHRRMLAAVVEHCKPSSVLEIGSFRGDSLSAFLSAPLVWAVEPNPTPELRELAARGLMVGFRAMPENAPALVARWEELAR